MTQKLTIPALDHGQAIADEILDGVSQSGGFPGLVGDTTHAEEGFGNLTVAGAVGPAIDGLQHMARTAQLLLGQSGILWHRTPMKRLDEAADSFDAIKGIRVEGHKSRQRLGAIDADQPDQMQRLPVAEIVEEVRAGSVEAGFIRIEGSAEIAVGGKQRGNIRQDDNAAVFFWRPEDGDLSGGENRVDKEIAGPSDAAPRSQATRTHPSVLRPWNSHADTRCCAATIPRRGRAPQGDRYSRSSVTLSSSIYRESCFLQARIVRAYRGL